MIKVIFILIILNVMMLYGCNSSSTVNKEDYTHTDSFTSLEINQDIYDTNIYEDYTNSENIQDINNINEFNTNESINNDTELSGKINIIEHKEIDYTDEEIEEMEREYNENAEPNIIVNDEYDNNDTELTAKTIILDGVEYTVYINE